MQPKYLENKMTQYINISNCIFKEYKLNLPDCPLSLNSSSVVVVTVTLLYCLCGEQHRCLQPEK